MTLPDAPTSVNQAQCGSPDASSAFEALDAATAGDWDRIPFFSTVLGETHSFANSDYWAIWVGRAGGFVFGNGICDQVLQQGDELLLLVDVSPPPTYASTVLPLRLRGVPATVKPGEAFNVYVDQYASDNGAPGTGTADPAEGVVVTGGAVKATTNAAGAVSLTVNQRGEATITARSEQTGARPVTVCVTDGADGFCGSTTSAPGAPATAPPAPVPDVGAAPARIAGIGEQQRFARGKAPRVFSGTVDADASGIKEVRLRLTRRVPVRSGRGIRCERLDFVTERWTRMTKCGADNATFRAIGNQASWSYLLPSALTTGRYVFDVQTVDGAGNVTRGATRGKPGEARNRVVFHVG